MPRIAEESIRQVVEASDIVDVIGSYLKLQRAGTSLRGLCPFHQEKSPSFHVSPAKQVYHCFGCGAGGGVLKFVMDYEQLDFASAVRRLAERAGVDLIEEAGGGDGRPDVRKRLIALHAAVSEWYHTLLLKSTEAEVARAYLKERGITSAVAKNWQLGYAPDGYENLVRQAREWGYNREEILSSGLVAPRESDQSLYDRFRGRMMIPICNDYGEVVGFSGRVLDSQAATAKYVNSPETPIFQKGRLLFGLHKTKRSILAARQLIVCEGQLDLITAYEHGVENVAAPQGTAFTSRQAALVKRFADAVVMCFDSDAAGQKAVMRSLPALLGEELEVRIMSLPGGDDPDSFIRREGAEAFRAQVGAARDIVDFQLVAGGGASNPTTKVRELANVLALMQDPVARDRQINKAAAALSLKPELLQREIARAKPAQGEQEAEELPREDENFVRPGPTTEYLCQLALMCPEAKAFLAGLNQPSPSELIPEMKLVETLAAASFDPRHPASLATWLSGQTFGLQSYIASLDLRRVPKSPLESARVTWDALVAQHLEQRIGGLGAKLHAEGLTTPQILAIQKEMLDLKLQLKDISRPARSEKPV